MEAIDMVEFWDRKSGSAYVAEWVVDHWQFAEREWNGVKLLRENGTKELLAQLLECD